VRANAAQETHIPLEVSVALEKARAGEPPPYTYENSRDRTRTSAAAYVWT